MENNQNANTSADANNAKEQLLKRLGHVKSLISDRKNSEAYREMENLLAESASAGMGNTIAPIAAAFGDAAAGLGFLDEAIHSYAVALNSFESAGMAEEATRARNAYNLILQAVSKPFSTALEAMDEYLGLIRLLLFRRVEVTKELGSRDLSKAIEIKVADAELNAFFSDSAFFSFNIYNLNRKVLARRFYLRIREEATLRETLNIPLFQVKKSFGLSEIVHIAFMGIIAPCYDHSFMRAYTRAWGDFTKRDVDVAFLTELCAMDRNEYEEIIDAFSDTTPLVKYSLVHLQPQKSGMQSDLLHMAAIADDRVLSYLRGKTGMDPALTEFAGIRAPLKTLEDVLVPEELREMAAEYVKKNDLAKTAFSGYEGCGRMSISESLCRCMENKMLVVNMEDLLDYNQPMHAIRMIFREIRLLNLIPVFRLPEDKFTTEGERSESRERLLWRIIRAIGEYPGRMFFIIPLNFPKLKEMLHDVVEFRIEMPTRNLQLQLWESTLKNLNCFNEDLASQINQLVGRFRLTGGAIKRAASIGLDRSRQRKSQKVEISDLIQGGQAYLSHRLDAIAQRIPSTIGWSDLIVPENTMNQLNEVIAYYKFREKVLNTWGFGKKLPYGRGLSALFWGPPGTGKTMAAIVLAGDFNLELFRIDLSRIVSKYIGETEKNISKLFDEASQGNVLLLFDEADSMFAKRTEVRDSVDRYANLEVNYLLQRIENFDGVAILTTNMPSSIDDAFKRRLRFSVEFPFPDTEMRKTLWKSMLPAEAEVEKNIEFEQLASDFEIAGGSIKNAVLKAAFKSAAEGKRINYRNLRKCAEMECIALGKAIRTEVNED
jgi:AAA+ superfamily predicted ATPase